DAPAWDAPLLPEDEERRIRSWSGADAAPPFTPVHLLIAQRAARAPRADAVVLGDEVLSYAELNAGANRIARRLAALGVAAEERVAVVADRSPGAVVAILGVLKAGCAYVPIDPANPSARAAEMVADAGVRFAIGAPGCEARIVEWGAAVVVDGGAGEDDADPTVEVHPAQLAYVIYTSGSTGTPKGVMVRHDGLAALALAFVDEHGFGPGERVLVVPPLSFDASVGDVFPALVSGAALVLHPSPGELGGAALLRFCREHRVTMVDTAAALWGQWADELASAPPTDPAPLRMVMMGGEAAPLGRAAAWARATGGAARLVNHYGPTEATVCATLQATTDGAEWSGRAASIPIGRAVAGARVRVLDGRGNTVPIGARGELCIGGAGVARGYLGRPGLTAERFVPDAEGEPGARMYRTGDRVRWLADGALEFVGRADHQLKVRGYRIEPGEIEAALLAHPGVRQALVTVTDDPPARRRLVAYVASDAAPAALRDHLRGLFPEYMVPAAVVVLGALPMTPHGKVDRRALPAPRPAESDGYVAPRTATERTLAALWAEVLDVPRVGADDDFFELGGHSLLALPLIHRARAALGLELPLRALFTAPTVAGMAAAADAFRAGGSDEAAPVLPPELRADLRLADDLRPGAPREPGRPPRSVVLTGATGFLGAYLLHGLLTETEAEVHCLVRAATAEEGRARIAANVASYLEWDDRWMGRIVPVVGDLGEPGLGLGDAEFRALGERADAIVHNGGVVNFTLPYGRMRGPNVVGTREVLRLACAGRATPLHFVSTLGVFLARELEGAPVDEDTPPPDVGGVHDAYTQTKWVADELVRAVAARGLPVTVHRPARVGPDARTGATNPDDFFSRMLRGIARMGAAPEVDWEWDVAPVNQVAAAIVRAVVDEGWLNRSYHYFNPGLLPFAEIVEAIREAGFPVSTIPYPEWRERAVTEAADAAHPLHPLVPLFPAVPRPREQPRFHTPGTDALMRASGTVWSLADRALVRRALTSFAARGVA
ncbi:MAG TPA: amino acid adenylation domain-containing protein, partial [Longimicrobium sp.]|nr:amino acid adenylation domain-containing protein [Longimicrobium sp.]